MAEHIRRLVIALVLIAGCGAAYARVADDDAALAQAIRANDVTGAELALAHHADPNQKLAFGATPLGWAVNTQNPAMVALLLAKGATPNAADIDGVTPLALACELGDAGVIAELLAAHADLRATRPDGTTPLAICARYGPADAVARMLTAGATADSVDERGQTPLMWAAASGRVEAIALLLKGGADANRVSKAGFTPLFFAIKSGVVPATEMLLAAGARPDYRGPGHTSAAQLALYQKNYGAAVLLVARGADVGERDREGNQLLHGAAAGGDGVLVAALLAKGADPNGLTGPSQIKWVTEANFGRPPPHVPPTPPLLIAAANGQIAAMKLLLAAGADPRFVAENKTNVTLAAARGGSASALELALSLAPDVNVVNANGETPLHLVVSGGPQPDLAAMLKILAAHGARTDIKSSYNMTAAEMADGGLTEVKAVFRAIFPDQHGVPLAGTGAKPTISTATKN